MDVMFLQKLRRAEDRWRELSAVRKPFNAHLDRWHNSALPDEYDSNQFIPIGEINYDDIQQAMDYQKAQNLRFLKIDSREPLPQALCQHFVLEESCCLTMALLNPNPSSWKRNPKVEIHSTKTHDIGKELVDFCVRMWGPDIDMDFVRRQTEHYVKRSKTEEGFAYFAAFLDGKIAGCCYVLRRDGLVELDGLIVDPDVRKQYVASSLLAYAAEQLEGILYLHADKEDTPKDMYAKMGFEIVDSLYEYVSVWK